MSPQFNAFPWQRGNTSCWGPGMDIRTYIATAALQGLLACKDRGPASAASDAVRYADALIAALNNRTTNDNQTNTDAGNQS